MHAHQQQGKTSEENPAPTRETSIASAKGRCNTELNRHIAIGIINHAPQQEAEAHGRTPTLPGEPSAGTDEGE